MRYIFNLIINRVSITKNPKSFSYGRFIQNNPNATKKERLKALKKFLDYTR